METSEVAIVSGDALERITRAEIDTAIATAQRFPRNMHDFANETVSLATLDMETAKSCVYALPRREKQPDGSFKTKLIRGESIRLAEIAASCFGNFRCGARVIAEEDDFIVAQGFAHDLQRNNWQVAEVRRRITDRNGRRYQPDMIALTANAACAIARRNAIFMVIPKALARPAYKAALAVVAGDLQTLEKNIVDAVKHFAALGVDEPRLYAVLEVKGREDLTLDHIATLSGLATAIKDGEITVVEAFPTLATVEDKSRDDALAAALKGGKKDDAPDPVATGTQAGASEKKGGGKAQPDLPGTKREPGAEG